MLTFAEQLPDDVVAEASLWVRRRFDARGHAAQLAIVTEPMAVYRANAISADAVRPDALVADGVELAVLEGEEVVAFVTLADRGGRLRPVSLEIVGGIPEVGEALDLAEVSGDREGERELRVLRIRWLGASFFWVAGDRSEFVDRRKPGVCDEAGFVAEMGRRLALLHPSSAACVSATEGSGC